MPFVQKTVYSDPPSDYRNYAIDVRGRLINDICEMERAMDRYIAEHFCNTKEKVTELMEAIVCTKFLSFQAKSEIVQKILEKRNDATKDEARQVYTHLVGTIANQRNMLAHYSLDTSMAGLKKFQKEPGTISLLKYLHTKSVEYFTKKDAKKLSELIFNTKQFFSYVKHWRGKP